MKMGGSGRIARPAVCCALVLTGMLPSLVIDASETIHQYDELGRLKSVTSTDGTVVTYTYDAAGNRRSIATTAPIPNTPAGALSLSAPTYSVSESGGSVTISVARTGGSGGVVGVTYATSNGTATAGSDYTATSGTLSWAAGDTGNKTFAIPITNDSTFENNETVTITLSAPTGGATLASPSTATLTIVNDDPAPPAGTLQLAASSYSVAENSGSVVITATRSGGSFGALSVSYGTSNGTAVAGSDYSSTTGTLSWADGDAASKSFSIPIIDDTSVELSESFSVSLASIVGSLGSPTSATITISDNDLPAITIVNASYTRQGAAGAVAIYELTSAGDIRGTSNAPIADVGDWLVPKNHMNRFEARATRTMGSHCTGPLGTWVNLGAGVTWTATVGNTSALTVGNCYFTLEIRDSVTGIVHGTANISLTAVDTPP